MIYPSYVLTDDERWQLNNLTNLYVQTYHAQITPSLPSWHFHYLKYTMHNMCYHFYKLGSAPTLKLGTCFAIICPWILVWYTQATYLAEVSGWLEFWPFWNSGFRLRRLFPTRKITILEYNMMKIHHDMKLWVLLWDHTKWWCMK